MVSTCCKGVWMVSNFSWKHSHPELDQGPASQEEGSSVLLPVIFSLLPIFSLPLTTQDIPLFNNIYLILTPCQYQG